MFDKFTDRALKVMGAARKAALDLQRDYIGVEHLLLGILDDPESAAGKICQKHQLTAEKIKNLLANSDVAVSTFDSIPFTPYAKLVLKNAVQCADNHARLGVGTEHLLHALVHGPEDSLPIKILAQLQVLENLKKDVIVAVFETQLRSIEERETTDRKDLNPKGNPADLNPKGSPADLNPKGSPADLKAKGLTSGFKWNFVSARCQIPDCQDPGVNGHWRHPVNRHQTFCWDHYKITRAQEASQDSADVITERNRIASALEAWHAMWSKPVRIAFTDKTVAPNSNLNKSWLLEFAKEIRSGTFDVPHHSEPDPLYPTD